MYNTSRKLALIFVPVGTIISIIINFSLNKFYSEVLRINVSNTFLIISAIIAIIIMIIAIVSIASNSKYIFIGVLLIIFCGAIAGVFYLTWQEETTYESAKSVASSYWLCPKCGKRNYYGNKCACGYEKHDNKYESHSWYCPKCGLKNYNTNECECGYVKNEIVKIEVEQVKTKYCSYCCEEIDDDADYCPKCGQKIKK